MMRFASLFVWIALPVALYAVYAVWGLPHLIWSYDFHETGGDSSGARSVFAERRYVDCTFVGPYGQYTVPARSGRCGWVRFFKSASDRLPTRASH